MRSDEVTRNLLKITSALSDETRVRVIFALNGRELCLCQIIELLGLSQSTVSRHVSILREAGLVESRREGKWSWFKIPSEGLTPAAEGALAWVEKSMLESERAENDRARLEEILGSDLEVMCQRTYRG